MLNRYSTKTV